MNIQEIENEVAKRKALFELMQSTDIQNYTVQGLPVSNPETSINMNVLNDVIFPNSINSSILSNQYDDLAFSCVNLRCDNVSKSKLMLYKEDNQSEKSEENSHIFLDLIRTECYNWYNENISYSELLWQTCWFLDIFGNAFWVIDRDILDRPSRITILIGEKELWRINLGKYGIESYTYCPNLSEHTRTIPARNIIHFKGQPKRAMDLFGMGTVEAGIGIFYLDNSVNIYQKKYFDNDAVAKFVLTTTKNMNDAFLQRYLEKFNQDNAGQFKAGRIPILPNGIEPKIIQSASKEADHIETWKFISKRLMTLFRVTPSLIGDLEDANRATDTYAHRNFLNFLLDSIIKKIDSKLTLFVKKAYDTKLVIEHQIKMPIDMQFEADELDREAQHGTITINEHRKEKGRDPIPDGDVLISSSKSVGKEPKPRTPEQKA